MRDVQKGRIAMNDKERVTENLHRAVAEYVKAHGGNVAVTGNIQVIRWPGDLKYNWTLGVKCTGTAPAAEAERE